ncbi:hypothetical protein SAMN02745120_0604 [Acetoanaerobium noterae]|uniref:Rho termination factor, N-terminal domain n=1 Tax=Acetoanaerobium noterae TaxID=745369 RepID=A0A1T5A138_9FIRM|nr:hypothetical protein [Acetoanaerobium noterae]SKB28373.1 hypothetical protein SAMN02745120_0604 [Acetoanaerobium noterae]
MKARVKIAFQDLKERAFRNAGSSFELTPERFKEINNAGYGVLVEEIKEEKKSSEVNKISMDDLKKMRKDDLISHANSLKIKVSEEDTKAEIIEKILGA